MKTNAVDYHPSKPMTILSEELIEHLVGVDNSNQVYECSQGNKVGSEGRSMGSGSGSERLTDIIDI